MAKLVSVVITSYNYARFIGRAIESALLQDYQNLEVIVCENGSTDGSLEEIARYQSDPRLRLVVNERNLGVIGNLNKGVAEAAGDYVVFLSADDFFLPGHISTAMSFYAQHPHVDVVYSPAIIVDADGKPAGVLEQRGYPRFDSVWGRNELSNLLVYDSFICFPTVLFRRDLFRDLGLLDESLHIAADFEFVIRIAAANKTFAFLNEPRVAVRYHANNHSSGANYVASGKQMEDYLRVLERYVVPENYASLAGFGAAITLLLDTRVADVRTHPVSAELLGRLDERIAALRVRLAAIPTLGDPALNGLKPMMSVIVPTTGSVALLDQALQSITAQAYENWEIVLVSDGGTDLRGYVSSLPFAQKVRYVRHSEAKGVAHARNRGHDVARGDVVAYLDEDNYFRAGYLERLAELFADPNVMVSRCDADLIVAKADRPASAARHALAHFAGAFPGSPPSLVSLVKGDTPLNCVAHRRACTLAIGGFDESLPVLEDWQFILRLSSQFAAHRIEESYIDIYYDRLMGDNLSLRNWAQFLPTLERLYNAYAAPQLTAARHAYIAELVSRVNALQASGHGQDEAIALIRAVSGSRLEAMAPA